MSGLSLDELLQILAFEAVGETPTANLIGQAIQVIDRFRDALEQVRDLIDDYVDVRDGGESGPMPNNAMRAQQIIDEVLR